jgi:opine dehydrogenase
MLKITVIGCGHGGQALSADLSRRGCQVTLYASPKNPGGINAIAKAKGINCTGLINHFVPIFNVTTHMEQAIKESEYIFMVLPSYAHESMFMEMLPFIQPGQTIITLAANFASLTYLKLLIKTNKTAGVNLIDIASLPYVCRADNLGTVDIISVKQMIAAASIPANVIEKHIAALAPIFPSQLLPYTDVLSLGMNITSGMTHPAVALLNAGRIGDKKEIFYFYRDGITPEIADMIGQLDAERIYIGKQLDLKMYSYLDLIEQYYKIRYDSIYQFFRESVPHNTLPLCPSSMQERYITQDVPNLLVPWYCIGKLINVEPTVLGNLITLASLINKTNYLSLGTNLVSLNFHDKNITEIKQYIKFGKLPPPILSMRKLNMRPLNDSTVSDRAI